jgi:hypothetical protein
VIWQTYLLKLAKSGEDGEKILLILESGSRFHTTKVGKLKQAHTHGSLCVQAPVRCLHVKVFLIKSSLSFYYPAAVVLLTT